MHLRLGQRLTLGLIRQYTTARHPMVTNLGLFSKQINHEILPHHPSSIRCFTIGSSKLQKETDTPSGHFKVSVEDGLRIIAFNRPKKYNAFLTEMFAELADLLNEAAADDNTNVTAITGSGPFFTAGNDLSNIKSLKSLDDIVKFIKHVEILGTAHINFNKALVAVVNGPAVGYGVTSLAFYDAVFSTDTATFHAPFTALGQCPEMCSSYLFPKIMGRANAAQLLLFNEKIAAAKAKELGLVTHVLPNSTFQDDVWPLVRKLAKLPPNSLKYSKGLLVDDERATLHKVNLKECEGLIKLSSGEECAIAIANFFKRK